MPWSLTLPAVRRTVPVAQGVVLLLVPAGGQASSRRHAWAAMSSDAARGRARREAHAAIGQAEARAAARRSRTGEGAGR